MRLKNIGKAGNGAYQSSNQIQDLCEEHLASLKGLLNPQMVFIVFIIIIYLYSAKGIHGTLQTNKKKNAGPPPESLQYLIQQRVKYTGNFICSTNLPETKEIKKKITLFILAFFSRSDLLVSLRHSVLTPKWKPSSQE